MSDKLERAQNDIWIIEVYVILEWIMESAIKFLKYHLCYIVEIKINRSKNYMYSADSNRILLEFPSLYFYVIGFRWFKSFKIIS